MPLVDKSIVLDRYLAASEPKNSPRNPNKSKDLKIFKKSKKSKDTLRWLETQIRNPPKSQPRPTYRFTLFFTQPQTTMENETKWSGFWCASKALARAGNEIAYLQEPGVLLMEPVIIIQTCEFLLLVEL